MRNNDRSGIRRRRMWLLPLFAVAGALVLGGIVMWLWNFTVAAIFSMKALTYWQAVGLLVLCKILFGSFRPGWGRRQPPWAGPPMHMREKWMNMTEEEQARFREEWKRRCAERKGA